MPVTVWTVYFVCFQPFGIWLHCWLNEWSFNRNSGLLLSSESRFAGLVVYVQQNLWSLSMWLLSGNETVHGMLVFCPNELHRQWWSFNWSLFGPNIISGEHYFPSEWAKPIHLAPPFAFTTLKSDWSYYHRLSVVSIDRGLSVILTNTCEFRSCFGLRSFFCT